jgi:hypothetical protein
VKRQEIRTPWTTTDVKTPKALTDIRQGGGLDGGDKQEGKGKDGLWQHIEGRDDRWIVVVVRKKRL